MTKQLKSSVSTQSGYTLTELLIVLAIISVLAGLMFPVLAAARARAHQAACISNLRQIGQAFRMYMDDYNERPPRFQSLWNSGLIKSKEVIICPRDETGNLGGLIYEGDRVRDEPQTPPETVHYSYLYPFGTDQPRGKALLEIEGSSAGIFVCQLHGQDRSHLTIPPLPPSILDHEGLVLRLQADGAVVRKQIIWQRKQTSSGIEVIANPWRLFSDAPDPML